MVRWFDGMDYHLSEIQSKLGRVWRQNFICHTTWRTIKQINIAILFTFCISAAVEA